MMQKSRNGYGRSRTTPRSARRAPPAVDHEASRVIAARKVAAAFVAARWPELHGINPAVITRRPQPPSADLLARLGLNAGDLAPYSAAIQYTFVFSGARGTADGAEAPLVASITVDDHHQIVKTSVTR